jgi:hypothetical protein
VLLSAAGPIAVSASRPTPARLARGPVPGRGPAARKAYAGFRYGWDRRMALGEPLVRGIADVALDG